MNKHRQRSKREREREREIERARGCIITHQEQILDMAHFCLFSLREPFSLLFSFIFIFVFSFSLFAGYQIVARRHENFVLLAPHWFFFYFVTHRSLLQIKIQMQMQMLQLGRERKREREQATNISDINSRTVSRNSLNSVEPCLFIHRPFPPSLSPLQTNSVHTSRAHTVNGNFIYNLDKFPC